MFLKDMLDNWFIQQLELGPSRRAVGELDLADDNRLCHLNEEIWLAIARAILITIAKPRTFPELPRKIPSLKVLDNFPLISFALRSRALEPSLLKPRRA